uniref:Uncharacterized protein n=1 Tax=Oryza sativa subsp. japonica TaxID=39947 RepID=Q67WL1_ORYSJ|nr:hypothetical protein [Oryza sativa Japonica Group]BAD37458.1 hypothetical protein [Oryza sativa Japonica Group]
MPCLGAEDSKTLVPVSIQLRKGRGNRRGGEAVRSRCSSALCRPLPSTPARSNAEPPDPVVAAPEPQPHAPVARRHTVPAADAGDASRHYASAPAATNVVCPASDRVEHQHLLGEKEGCIASLPRTPSPREHQAVTTNTDALPPLPHAGEPDVAGDRPPPAGWCAALWRERRRGVCDASVRGEEALEERVELKLFGCREVELELCQTGS